MQLEIFKSMWFLPPSFSALLNHKGEHKNCNNNIIKLVPFDRRIILEQTGTEKNPSVPSLFERSPQILSLYVRSCMSASQSAFVHALLLISTIKFVFCCFSPQSINAVAWFTEWRMAIDTRLSLYLSCDAVEIVSLAKLQNPTYLLFQFVIPTHFLL